MFIRQIIDIGGNSKTTFSLLQLSGPVACPGIRRGGGGGRASESFFCFLLFNFSRGGPAQKIT